MVLMIMMIMMIMIIMIMILTIMMMSSDDHCDYHQRQLHDNPKTNQH